MDVSIIEGDPPCEEVEAILHASGIDALRRASEQSISGSVKNALEPAAKLGLRPLAFPALGAGPGGFDQAVAERVLVRYRPRGAARGDRK